MMSKGYTREEVLAAITGDDPRYYGETGQRMGSAGIMSTVARRLGCDWHTAQKYVERWDSTRLAFADEGERVLDLAESKAIELINEKDGGMIRYYLSTKGKDRGFTERRELAGPGGGPVEVAGTLDLRVLTDDELTTLESIYRRQLEQDTAGEGAA